MVSPHLGNRIPELGELKSVALPDSKSNPQKIAALPIGGRIKLDPWNDKLEILKNKPVVIMAEREKLPFEVTPFMPYLTRYGSDTTKPAQAVAADSKGEPAKKPDDSSDTAKPAPPAPAPPVGSDANAKADSAKKPE